MTWQLWITFRIGGEAGQGVESGGAGFAKALARAGYHVVGTPDYYERIRGGHNSFTIRVSDEPVYAVGESVDVLIAMDSESLVRHVDKLTPQSAIVIDEETRVPDGALDAYRGVVARLPLLKIATDHGAPVMVNTGALAAAAQLAGVRSPSSSLASSPTTLGARARSSRPTAGWRRTSLAWRMSAMARSSSPACRLVGYTGRPRLQPRFCHGGCDGGLQVRRGLPHDAVEQRAGVLRRPCR